MELVSEPNYHTTKFFTENYLAIEIRKTQIITNKPVYLGLSILDLRKTVMYEFRYVYVKSKLVEMQNFVIWIQRASLLMEKQMIFTKILQKMLKHDLALEFLK